MKIVMNKAFKRLHQMDYHKILELQHTTNGIVNDYCHPRFIALMLCLGDLLDLDTDRFNEYFLDVTTPLPNDSAMHKSKHESIVHYKFFGIYYCNYEITNIIKTEHN